MTPEQWIREQIEARGITQRFVARSIGMPAVKLNNTLTGRRQMKIDEYLNICRVLHVNPLDCPAQEAVPNAGA